MSWIGAGIGAFLGAQRGSILGGIIGAVIGNWVEGKVRDFVGGTGGDASSGGNASASPNELATLAAISASCALSFTPSSRMVVGSPTSLMKSASACTPASASCASVLPSGEMPQTLVAKRAKRCGASAAAA